MINLEKGKEYYYTYLKFNNMGAVIKDIDICKIQITDPKSYYVYFTFLTGKYAGRNGYSYNRDIDNSFFETATEAYERRKEILEEQLKNIDLAYEKTKKSITTRLEKL